MDVIKQNWSNEHSSLRIVENTELPQNLRGVREIIEVFTKPEGRKQGSASSLLREVCDDADVKRVVLILQPKPFGRGRRFTGLEGWYAKFGFVRIQDEPVLMARMPS